MTMSTNTTQNVGSHVAEIDFYGARVPIGFLGTFRKKKHPPCAALGGFVVANHLGGKKANVLCHCAIAQAQKKLRQVKRSGFEQLGRDWREAAMKAVEEAEALCREEGKAAAGAGKLETDNPYPENSDQNLAWRDGFMIGKGTPDA